MFVSHSSEFRTSERNLSHRFTAFRLIGCLALAVIFGLTQFDVAKLFSQEATRSGPTTEDVDSPELLFFYDETTQIDPTSAAAIKTAVESGFRIREIAARRFPRLAERFKVRSFPSLIMLRRDRTHARHDGRFTFGRIREMFARARERRLERREDFRRIFARCWLEVFVDHRVLMLRQQHLAIIQLTYKHQPIQLPQIRRVWQVLQVPFQNRWIEMVDFRLLMLQHLPSKSLSTRRLG